MKIAIPLRLLAPALLLLLCPAALAQETVADASPEKALLQRSMDFLSSLPAFSADIEMNFALADKSGQTRDGALKGHLDCSGTEKARFRVDVEGGTLELYYAPESKFLYISEQNQYVDGKSFGDRKSALTLIPSREFSPAQIMLSDFLHGEASLLESMESATLVGAEGDGADAPDHVQGMGGGITVDFWLRRGEQPFLEKLQLDLLKMASERNPGLAKALVTYTFSNWNGAPEFAADHFTFTKPEGATELDTSAKEPADPLVGKPAPSITLSLLDGGTLDLARHQGKDVVILDFWASWCGPCRKGLPIASEVAGQFKDKNVVFYAVNVGETADVAKGFLAQSGLDFPVALDPDRDAQQKYQATSIPKTVIIAKDGTVREVHQGLAPSLKEDLTKTLTELTN
jgi:thiol-disulfide isomerase/thioredoxin